MKHIFLYPVTEFGSTPPRHIGDLSVTITVDECNDGSYEVDIDRISWKGHNVGDLIQAISPDEFDSIVAAANGHAEGKYGKREETIMDTMNDLMKSEQHESKEFEL